MGKILSDFLGSLLLRPCVHFHLQLDAKMRNVNNNIILSVTSAPRRSAASKSAAGGGAGASGGLAQAERQEQEDEDRDNMRFGRTSAEVDSLLNFGFDEYTNSLVEICLYDPRTKAVNNRTGEYPSVPCVAMDDRCISMEAKVCVVQLMGDVRALMNKMHQAVTDLTGISK